MMAIRAVSFDVYDTLVTRPYLAPRDLFLQALDAVMARTRRRRAGILEQALFARLRLWGEKLARRSAAGEDIEVDAIYGRLGLIRLWGLDPSALRDEEVRLEARCPVAVAANVRRVEEARSSGRQVLFVSDMYLPTSLVQELLLRLGIARPHEPVYVSGALGLTKHSGRLFDHVLEREGLAPQELLHIGDNPHSDVAVPRTRGIETQPVDPPASSAFEVGPMRTWPVPSLSTSHRAGASRAVRVMRLDDPARTRGDAVAVAAGVGAPLLALYVRWALSEAAARSASRLLVRRPARALAEIARGALPPNSALEIEERSDLELDDAWLTAVEPSGRETPLQLVPGRGTRGTPTSGPAFLFPDRALGSERRSLERLAPDFGLLAALAARCLRSEWSSGILVDYSQRLVEPLGGESHSALRSEFLLHVTFLLGGPWRASLEALAGEVGSGAGGGDPW